MYTTYFQQPTADTTTAQSAGAYYARFSSCSFLDAIIMASIIILSVVLWIPMTS